MLGPLNSTAVIGPSFGGGCCELGRLYSFSVDLLMWRPTEGFKLELVLLKPLNDESQPA
jgi:hypothetical protein